jgi:hypothetical protein
VRPVDGVDVPAHIGGLVPEPELLALCTVRRESIGNPPADQLLDCPIGGRDEAAVRLGGDLVLMTEGLQRQRIGGVRAGEREGEPLAELRLAPPP